MRFIKGTLAPSTAWKKRVSNYSNHIILIKTTAHDQKQNTDALMLIFINSSMLFVIILVLTLSWEIWGCVNSVVFSVEKKSLLSTYFGTKHTASMSLSEKSKIILKRFTLLHVELNLSLRFSHFNKIDTSTTRFV